MTPDRWRLIKQLFNAALEQDEPARGAWLDRECAGDDALRSEVASLLTAHEAPTSVLDAPAKDRAGLNHLRLETVLKEELARLVLRKGTRGPEENG
jgi:hypothetical protein